VFYGVQNDLCNGGGEWRVASGVISTRLSWVWRNLHFDVASSEKDSEFNSLWECESNDAQPLYYPVSRATIIDFWLVFVVKTLVRNEYLYIATNVVYSACICVVFDGNSGALAAFLQTCRKLICKRFFKIIQKLKG
jgi:hypothetical protein